MINIKAGDIFLKDYIDHQRYFVAIEDSVGLYCYCLDINDGGPEIVKLPMLNSSTKITML